MKEEYVFRTIARVVTSVLLMAAAVASCGKKGPLYLPAAGPVVPPAAASVPARRADQERR